MVRAFLHQSLPLFIAIIIFIIAIFLRFYHLDTNPPGLYIDEASIGFNAYKILTTGKDEYNQPYPIFFQAFGEYKMPVYIYLTTAAMTLFGKTEFAVRFPSAFFGSLTIIVCFFLTRKLFEKENIPFTSVFITLVTFLLAISPWHIQFSRGGFEVTVGVFFYLLGWLSFLYFLTTKQKMLLSISLISFIVALYSYNIFRVIIPLTLCFCFYLSRQYFLLQKKQLVSLVLSIAVVSFPMILFSFSQVGLSRFNQTSAFTDYTGSFYQNLYTYPFVFFKNFISYFSPVFLFSYGDRMSRHLIPNMGPLFLFESIFLFIGLYFFLKHVDTKVKGIVLFLLLISPIAAALARPSPHLLRSLPLVYPLTILVAYGFVSTLHLLKKKARILSLLVFLCACFEVGLYMHMYYIHYPKTTILEWGGGDKQLVQKTQKVAHLYKAVYADKGLALNYVYFGLYGDSMPIYVPQDWVKPETIKEPVLYITRKNNPPSIQNRQFTVLDTVVLPNDNKDTYAYLIAL